MPVSNSQGESPIAVTWISPKSLSITTQGQLPIKERLGSISALQREYKAVHVPNVNTMVDEVIMNDYKPVNKKEEMQIGRSLIEEFSYDSIREVRRQETKRSCGAMVKEGVITFLNCPGVLTVISLHTASTFSCAGIKNERFYGPIILKNEICHQTIVARANCSVAFDNGYLRNGCKIVEVTKGADGILASLILVSLLMLSISFSIIIFSIRVHQLKESAVINVGKKGMKIVSFSYHNTDTDSKVRSRIEPMLPNVNKEEINLSVWRLLLSVLCFCPFPVKSYDLINTFRSIDGQHKYTLDVGSNEMIPLGVHGLGFSGSSMIAELRYQFDTYNWKLDKRAQYSCLQSGCNSKMDCREDLLPFRPANKEASDFLGLTNKTHNYAMCKNMNNYCMYAHGCIAIGFALVMNEEDRFSVFSINRQMAISRVPSLPPGCYLDSISQDRDPGLTGLYYVEDSKGNSWFCHSSLYSHHPLPNSLGDLKTDKSGVVNFILDEVICATDHWRDIMCTHPRPFVSEIDSYCVRNDVQKLGRNVQRAGMNLDWKDSSMVTLKITCDRDLGLKYSSSHCSDLQIDVWDTMNQMSDLLMTIQAISISGEGVYELPGSVHTRVRRFPCDGKTYSTLLFDLQSLNSSGITYSYHRNSKNLVPDDDDKDHIIIPDSDNSNGSWFDGMGLLGRTLLPGIPLVALLLGGLLLVCVCCRKR